MIQIPNPLYEPDKVKNIPNTKLCDTLNNIFIDNEGNFINVPLPVKRVDQPSINGVTERLTNLFATPTTSGAFTLFGGSANHLWAWSNVTHNWTNVYDCRHGGSSDEEKGSRWTIYDFKDMVLASKPGEGILIWDGSSSFIPLVAKQGKTPDAGAIYVSGDFVIAYRVQDAKDTVYWCGVKDPYNWDYSSTGGAAAGFNIITRGKEVTAVIGGQNPYLFTLRQLYRMTRVSGVPAWSFQLVSSDLGVYDISECSEINNMVAFHDTQSQYLLDSNNNIKDIGRYRVSETWKYPSDTHNLRVLGDVINRRFYYVYQGRGTLIYNTEADSWSTMDWEGLDVFIGNFTVETFDDLDNQYSNICLYPFNLNSVRDTYSCSLAFSKPDGIYLMDESQYSTVTISSPIIADTDNKDININNAQAVCDNQNIMNEVQYNNDYQRYSLNQSSKNMENKWGYSNYRIRAKSFKIISTFSGFKFFRGWNVNVSEGIY